MGTKAERIEKELLLLLSRFPEGLTVTEATKRTGYNYMTVSRHLAILEARGKVEPLQIGMAKLYRAKTRVRKVGRG